MTIFEDEIDRLLQLNQDQDLICYIKDVIQEHDEEGQTDHDLADALASYSSHFAQLPRHEQQDVLVRLLHACASTSGEEKEGVAVEALPMPIAPLPPPPAFPDPPTTMTTSTTKDDSSESKIALLASLCPCRVPAPFLLHLLTTHANNDLQRAAHIILEMNDEDTLQAQVNVWNQKFSSKIPTATTTTSPVLRPVDDQLRKSIVARFHLESIPMSTATTTMTKGASAGWDPDHKQQQQQQKVRYRDGAVVSTKGEKFVVEKQPEWDGGSRGRVKSKRKGGTGWY